MPSSSSNRKKKKKAAAAAVAATTPTTDTTQPADSAASPAPAADTHDTQTAPSSTSAPAAVDYKRSAYEMMTLHPITSLSPLLTLSSDHLSSKINALPPSASHFSIYASVHDTIGRRAIAGTALAPGTLIIRERASPAVLHQSYAHKLCARCYEPLYDSAATAAAGREEARVRGCRACENVMYCSMECLMRDSDTHRDECRALKDIDRLSDESLVNVDLVRAALAYIVMRKGAGGTANQENDEDEGKESKDQGASQQQAAAIRADDFTPDWQDVDGMVDNLSSVSAVDKQHMTSAATLLLALLPPRLHLPIPSLVSFMSRVNNNSHAISPPSTSASSAAAHVGFGLFPLCSILNHSCYPNTIYTSDGTHMVMRVIRPVQAGEELTVNYIGLYASLRSRRTELLESKKFLCECRRCTLRPATEEERGKFMFDQYVGGVRCRKDASKTGKRCGGIYRLMVPIVPSERRKDGDAGGAVNDVLVCGECGDRLAYAELDAVEAEWHDKVETALSLYASQSSSPSSLHAHLTSLTSSLLSVFHPHHHLVFNLSLPIINLLQAMHAHRERRDAIRQARTLASHVYPPHYLPSVNYMQAEVAALQAILQAAGSKMPRKLAAKYKEELAQLVVTIVDALTVCLGEDSEAVRKERSRLAELVGAVNKTL